MRTTTFLRRLLPALLLGSLALASCERKDHDPRPNNRCGSKTAPPTSGTGTPGGPS